MPDDKRPPEGVSPKDRRKIEDQAQNLAQIIGGVADSVGVGFALLFFTWGEGGWSTYVSNAEREDMVKALRECADNLEHGRDVAPLRQE